MLGYEALIQKIVFFIELQNTATRNAVYVGSDPELLLCIFTPADLFVTSELE